MTGGEWDSASKNAGPHLGVVRSTLEGRTASQAAPGAPSEAADRMQAGEATWDAEVRRCIW